MSQLIYVVCYDIDVVLLVKLTLTVFFCFKLWLSFFDCVVILFQCQIFAKVVYSPTDQKVPGLISLSGEILFGPTDTEVNPALKKWAPGIS